MSRFTRPSNCHSGFGASPVGHVDVTGGEALRSVYDTLAAIGTRLIIARAKSSVRGALRRQGIADVVGEDNFAPTVARALDADTPALR